MQVYRSKNCIDSCNPSLFVLFPSVWFVFDFGFETQFYSIAQVGIEFIVYTVQADLKLSYKVKY